MTDCNDQQPGDDSPDQAGQDIGDLIREAMNRSEALVRDAMRLGRETCRPDSMPGVVLR